MIPTAEEEAEMAEEAPPDTVSEYTESEETEESDEEEHRGRGRRNRSPPKLSGARHLSHGPGGYPGSG